MPFLGTKRYRGGTRDFERINEVMVEEVFPELSWYENSGSRRILIRPLVKRNGDTRGEEIRRMVLTIKASEHKLTREEVGYWLDGVLLRNNVLDPNGRKVRTYHTLGRINPEDIELPIYLRGTKLVNVLLMNERKAAEL